MGRTCQRNPPARSIVKDLVSGKLYRKEGLAEIGSVSCPESSLGFHSEGVRRIPLTYPEDCVHCLSVHTMSSGDIRPWAMKTMTKDGRFDDIVPFRNWYCHDDELG